MLGRDRGEPALPAETKIGAVRKNGCAFLVLRGGYSSFLPPRGSALFRDQLTRTDLHSRWRLSELLQLVEKSAANAVLVAELVDR